MPSANVPITLLLRDWSAGDRDAEEQVLFLVYDELRRIAARQLGQERAAHTLRATALVNEAYLRLSTHAGFEWPSRGHFFSFATRLIRRILVDYARNRNRAKRGGQSEQVDLDEVTEPALEKSPDLVALDEALSRLERIDPRKGAVVELRYFAGLSIEETARHLGVSAETVSRDWRYAKAWLYKALQQPSNGAATR
jgi:RNA polymerase sigma-70 factor, ECF subfamily